MESINRSRWLLVLVLMMSVISPSIAQVTADFTANITADCSPLIVNFQNNSTNATSYQWYFGNGNSSVQTTPGAIYSQAGSYSVTLIASDGSVNDTLTRTAYINVFADPNVQFSVSDTIGCTPFGVQFINNTTPGDAAITSMVWNFGDGGSSSTSTNPTHSYLAEGVFSVTLLVQDANGCSDELNIPNLISTQQSPVAEFTSDVMGACEPPLNVNFTNQSTSLSPATYQWSLGNNEFPTTTDPSTTYLTLGNFNVELIATTANGCADTMTKPAFIQIADLSANFQADVTQGCAPLAVNFQDLSMPGADIWQWDFGDGGTSTDQNPSYTFTQPGNYTVSLFAEDTVSNCDDLTTKTIYITVFPSPAVTISSSAPASCSLPFTTSFQATSTTATSYAWSFGDGSNGTGQNPSHTYTTAGEFDVIVVAASSNGCTTTVIDSALVIIRPAQADFVADTIEGCVPLTVDFLDTSITATPIVSYFWDLGDGTTSTAANPTHTYTAVGEYDVSLMIEDSLGCRDTILKTEYIRAGNLPTADFIAAPLSACLSDPITFTNNSSANATEAYWLFGDGGNSSQLDPIYTYGDTGTFDVMLIAIDRGCRDTLERLQYLTINPPDARFNVVRDCNNPFNITFEDQSISPDTWLWEFGDGQTSNAQNPTHVYGATGTYSVRLTVDNLTTGCTDVELKTVRIADLQPDFTVTNTVGCAPYLATFQDNSRDAVAYRWYFGTGDSSNLANPAYTYTDTGKFTVRLRVTDVNGCVKFFERPDYVSVHQPFAKFFGSPVSGCAPLNVQFIDSSTAYDATVVAWHWDFGTGDTAVGPTPNYTFDNPGDFNVTLTVTDDIGCQNAITYGKFVKPTFPAPSFTVDTLACTANAITFTNTSVGDNLSFVWDFGDSNTSTGVSPTHLYTVEGNYTVMLTATDANGCDSTLALPGLVEVRNPVAGFMADSTFSPCPPFLVNFSDTSSSDIVSWFWDFGDGETSALPDPTHVYLEPDTYAVTLVTTSITGCVDTAYQDDFIIVLGPYGTFNFTPSNECVGNDITFLADVYNTIAITYDFGDGTVKQAPDSTVHAYGNIGIYHPTLILDDGQGCLHTINTTDSVTIGQLDPAFTVDTTYQCKTGAVSFTDQSFSFPAVTSWTWYFGDGDSSNLQNPTHLYTDAGTYDVTLRIDNGLCIKDLTYPALIHIDRGPQANFIVDSVGCVPIFAQFTDLTQSDSTIASWSWDLGNGLTDTVQNPTYNYDTAGTFTVQLVVTSVTGCSDTNTTSITVNSLPIADAGDDTFICDNSSIQLNATGGVVYAWSPPNGLSDTSISDPIASPISLSTYVLTVTDANGCVDTDSISIDVKPVPTPTTSPDREVCLGNTAEIWASGGAKYLWSPDSTASCDDCSATVVAPTSTTTYLVEVKDSNLCIAYDSVRVVVNPLPIGLISGDTAICSDQSTVLEAAAAQVYDWFPAAGLSCNNCQDPIADPDSTTRYLLLTATDKGCTSSDTITVTVNAVPEVNTVAADEVCLNDTLHINTGGGAAYAWSPSTGLSCDDCPDPIAQPLESTDYFLTVTSAENCVSFDTLSITVRDLPEITTVDGDTVCAGDKLELSSSYVNTTSVLWSPAADLSFEYIESPTARPDSSTMYVVTATSPHNCIAQDSVYIGVVNKVRSALTQDTEICFGESVDLTASALQEGNLGTQVVWSPVNFLDNTDSKEVIATPEKDITYKMIAYSGSCIPDTQLVNITVHQLPEISIGGPIEAVKDQVIPLAPSSTKPVTYEWLDDRIECATCDTAYLNAQDPGLYFVRATDEFGCEDMDSVQLKVVSSCLSDVYVPNTFSPNGDGVNEKLMVRGLTLTDISSFRVYDRWGTLVFESDNMINGWDGTKNGLPLSSDVFVYYVEAVCGNGQVAIKSGNVTLLR